MGKRLQMAWFRDAREASTRVAGDGDSRSCRRSFRRRRGLTTAAITADPHQPGGYGHHRVTCVAQVHAWSVALEPPMPVKISVIGRKLINPSRVPPGAYARI